MFVYSTCVKLVARGPDLAHGVIIFGPGRSYHICTIVGPPVCTLNILAGFIVL